MLPTLYSYGRSLAKSNIQYLHRTVRDYLEAPDIWRSIECAAPTEGEGYWVLSLCLGYIMLWKSGDEKDLKIQATKPPTLQLPPAMPSSLSFGLPPSSSSPELTPTTTLPSPVIQSDEVRKENSRIMLENCVELATNFLRSSLQSYIRLLDAIGAAIFDGGSAVAECNQQEVLSSAIWSNDTLGFVFEDFLTLAVHLNLFAYVETKISHMPPALKVATVSRLFIVATLKREQWLYKRMMSLQKNWDYSKRVCGTDVESDTAPDHSVKTEHEWKDFDMDEVDNPSFHMMQMLMRHGANPDFLAYGTSARQNLTLRYSELAGSQYFQNLLWILDFTRDDSGRFIRRVRSVFHRHT